MSSLMSFMAHFCIWFWMALLDSPVLLAYSRLQLHPAYALRSHNTASYPSAFVISSARTGFSPSPLAPSSGPEEMVDPVDSGKKLTERGPKYPE